MKAAIKSLVTLVVALIIAAPQASWAQKIELTINGKIQKTATKSTLKMSTSKSKSSNSSNTSNNQTAAHKPKTKTKKKPNQTATVEKKTTKSTNKNSTKLAAKNSQAKPSSSSSANKACHGLNGVEGDSKIDVRDVEKAAFNAAETYYIENENIYKIEKYLQDYPDGANVSEARYYIAHYYYSKHDYKSAMDAINDVLEGNVDASLEQRAMALKGALLLEQGRGKEAMEVYKTWSTKANNKDNFTKAQLGVFRSAYDVQDREAIVKSANILLGNGCTLTSKEEQEVILARALANLSMAQGDLTKLSANTQSEAGAQAAYEIARFQYESGDLNRAEKSLDNLIGNDTDHAYWVAKGFILLCDIYNDQGKQSEAVEYLISLKNNYPGNEDEIFKEIEKRLNDWQKKIQ